MSAKRCTGGILLVRGAEVHNKAVRNLRRSWEKTLGVPHRSLMFLAVSLLGSASAWAGGGLSAQLEIPRAVEGQPLEIALRTEDPLGLVKQVRVQVRARKSTAWQSTSAEHLGSRWVARWPASELPPAGESVEIRVELLGERGGLLLDLGYDEPFEARVKSAPEAVREQALMSTGRPESSSESVSLLGTVGLDGRLASGARLRALVAIGFPIRPEIELGLGLTVGPVFASDASGGPIVLGVELPIRFFALDPRAKVLAPFVEVFPTADLRFPGLDAGGGLRAGLTWYLGGAVSLDAALGGALMGRSLAGIDEDPDLGFTGGLRFALRFDGRAR